MEINGNKCWGSAAWAEPFNKYLYIYICVYLFIYLIMYLFVCSVFGLLGFSRKLFFCLLLVFVGILPTVLLFGFFGFWDSPKSLVFWFFVVWNSLQKCCFWSCLKFVFCLFVVSGPLKVDLRGGGYHIYIYIYIF